MGLWGRGGSWGSVAGREPGRRSIARAGIVAATNIPVPTSLNALPALSAVWRLYYA